jgi:hypothetical protein
MTIAGLLYSEELTTRGFALQLFDGFTGQCQLEGEVAVSIAGRKPRYAKTDSATFVFLDLGAGAWTISVQPSPRTPFYLPVTIPVSLPLADPLWQAYPDLSLADRSKPLNDPSQPAAYKAQRALATLRPTPSYPFPPGATLVRGTVLAGGVPLAGATVIRVGDDAGTLSDDAGEFVLSFEDVPLFDGAGDPGQAATISATHPLKSGSVDVQVTLLRGTTVSIQMVMTP